MNNKSHMSFWQVAKKAALIALCSVTLALGLYFVFQGLFLRVLSIDRDNLQYLKYYYNHVNDSQVARSVQDQVVIINTQELGDGLDARKNIAQLLDTICEHDPLVVGVDLLFSSDKDTLSDAYLKSVVRKYADKIVLASGLENGNTLLPNIFDNDPSLHFGLVNLPSYSSYSPSVEVDGTEYPRFSYLISQIAHPDQKIDFKHFLVNYTPKDFEPNSALLFLEGTDAQKDEDVSGKVVLIGDTDNAKDYHESPFKLDGGEWTQGIYLHAYALYSLLNPESYAMKKVGLPGDILICFVMCFLFSLAFVFIINAVDKIKKERRKGYYVYLFFKPLFLILANFLIWLICYVCLTKPFRLVPNVVFYMVSTFLINNFNDLITNAFKIKKDE